MSKRQKVEAKGEGLEDKDQVTDPIIEASTEEEVIAAVHDELAHRGDQLDTRADVLISATFLLQSAAQDVSMVYVSPEITSMLGNLVMHLGTHKMPNQQRLHKHGRFDYRAETRKHSIKVWVEVTHPDMDDIRSDVEHCVRVAGTTAVVVAVATDSPTAGMRIFYPAFIRCLALRTSATVANKSRAKLKRKNSYTCWTNHCNFNINLAANDGGATVSPNAPTNAS